MLWVGGDPVLHKDWFAIVNYSIEKGMRNSIFSSTLISKKLAKELVQIKNGLDMLGIHIDTINQENYNKLHTNPKTLQDKIRGYYNLLDAGYPPEQVMGCITLTKYSVETIEETLDWHIDEMGSKFVGLLAFKREGFGGLQRDFEPSLSEVKRAHEYRAEKLGKDLLKIGSSDVGLRFCRSNVYIKFDGRVTPCPMLSDLAVSNIHETSLGDILKHHRNSLLFNSKIEGFCGNGCDNRDVCFGCRATAYHYTGDVYASDPKCWMNPEAKEYYS
jgi:MoaA/NifB/PqqE/SkfB family radical SAM enzyme